MYKQIIIARKDLNMSPGKLAAQVSHGSMAFLTNMISINTIQLMVNQFPAYNNVNGEKLPQYYGRDDLNKWAKEAREKGEEVFYARFVNPEKPYFELELCEPEYKYHTFFDIDKDLYEQWIQGSFTKCVLSAKNKGQLLKAAAMAEELGMKEGEDFFLIRDNCCTELEPEENGTTLTVIGFKPMDSEVIDKIRKKYQLYK